MKKECQYTLPVITVLFTLLVISVLFIRQNTGTLTKATEGTAISETVATTSKNSSIIEGKLNINAATAEELTMLPGIGEVIAQRIVDYRRENGPFTSAEELKEVKGIGDARLKAIIDYITLGE